VEIRRNGELAGDVTSHDSPPSDEVSVLQALRVTRYMDAGRSGYLPWTDPRLRDWPKSKVGGVDIRNDARTPSCCERLGVGDYIVLEPHFGPEKELYWGWKGVETLVTLLAHEARHVASFPRASDCGASFGCDETYDEANLFRHGIQWWLERAWLTGHINVRIGCLSESERNELDQLHLRSANGVHRGRFAVNKPQFRRCPPFRAEPAKLSLSRRQGRWARTGTLSPEHAEALPALSPCRGGTGAAPRGRGAIPWNVLLHRVTFQFCHLPYRTWHLCVLRHIRPAAAALTYAVASHRRERHAHSVSRLDGSERGTGESLRPFRAPATLRDGVPPCAAAACPLQRRVR
jgi:hypothetical protein